MAASSPQKKANGADDCHEEYMRAPDPRSKWQIFKDGIYNPAAGTILGRTKKRWGIVGLFYLIFYSVLALLCAICMMGLLATIDETKPKYTLDSSIIGTNPGLGFRPISDRTEERSLIWYDPRNATQIKEWVNRLDKFLENYLNKSKLPESGRNQVICDYDKPPQEGKVCAVDVNSWGPCSPSESYGFNNSSPCIFIKLNRIYDWIPEYYNDSSDLPDDMPQDIKDHIKTIDKSQLNTVWVSCKGEDPHDKESIGELEYYPRSQGFPGYYYPFSNVPGYLSPVVAVHLKRPTRKNEYMHLFEPKFLLLEPTFRPIDGPLQGLNIKLLKKGSLINTGVALPSDDTGHSARARVVATTWTALGCMAVLP